MVDAAKVVELVKDARERRSGPLILELDLTDGLVDGPITDPLAAILSMRRPHLRDVLDGLRRARTDSRVVGLIAKIGGPRLGLAITQELRAAVLALTEAGKTTIAWAESFGENPRSTVPYYLATAFERIYTQPSGDLAFTGVAMEEPFLNEALGKLGVTPQFGKRYEYKNAVNTFTERDFTPAHREASERIVASIVEQVVAGVAQRRGLEPGRVRELIDASPLLADEAVEAGLIDGLAYRDEIYAKARGASGAARGATGATATNAGSNGHNEHQTPLRYVSRYSRAARLTPKLPQPRADGIALIEGHGPIRLGRSGRSPMPGRGGVAMGSDTVAAALRAAARDEHVRAIVFRVDSPGGSYVASDTIWREVTLARKAGKPVVISMGNVAASGGYFVAAPGTKIFAQPGTITGSIGVLTGKAVVTGALDRLGISMGSVENGAHSRMYAATREFTEEEWNRLNAFLDRIYEDFVGKVATGRDMPRDRVHELARGRVWTGADAHERGLVDALGGLDDAVAEARRLVGLGPDAPLRAYPRSSPLERLRPAESSEDRTAATARLDAWGPLSSTAARLGLPLGGPLMLPGSWDIA
jgi:protease-4